jgi:hypothetical protein
MNKEYRNITVKELIEILNEIPDKEKKISIVYDKGSYKLCGKIKALGWVNILGQSEGEYTLIVKEK